MQNRSNKSEAAEEKPNVSKELKGHKCLTKIANIWTWYRRYFLICKFKYKTNIVSFK